MLNSLGYSDKIIRRSLVFWICLLKKIFKYKKIKIDHIIDFVNKKKKEYQCEIP